MSTVIIGGGIIGSSVAYFLTNDSSPYKDHEVHVIESSSQLFSAASGYAAGFLAKDWFSPAVAPLGALSFDLHHQLAAENGGKEKWGYMQSTALSLDVNDGRAKRTACRGDDWLREGTSRAEVAAKGEESSTTVMEEAPAWLTKQKGGRVEPISDEGTVAQVDPLRLCKYLMETTVSRGVKWHHPAQVISVVTDRDTNAISAVKVLNSVSQTESVIPCTNLVICAGPWTSRVFNSLFPSAKLRLNVSALAGYSLVLRSPRHTLVHEHDTYRGRSHAVFTTHPRDCGFSPEVFSREGAEIYIAGLNSSDIPLPSQAEESREIMDKQKIQELKAVAVRLMGRLAEGNLEASDDIPNVDDLEVLREGLCFRPVTISGRPVISRISEDLLGIGVKSKSPRTGREKGGVFVATGHGPWGISLSLGTGKVVAEMVDGVKTSADVSGLSV